MRRPWSTHIDRKHPRLANSDYRSAKPHFLLAIHAQPLTGNLPTITRPSQCAFKSLLIDLPQLAKETGVSSARDRTRTQRLCLRRSILSKPPHSFLTLDLWIITFKSFFDLTHKHGAKRRTRHTNGHLDPRHSSSQLPASTSINLTSTTKNLT